MADSLVAYNRDMNRVFGACIEIQNTARTLDQTMLEMELLARNGVAKAARLSAGHGRPLLVLAEILADLPREIRGEVRGLDEQCQRLTRMTADASNVVRLYYQLVRSLVDIHDDERGGLEGHGLDLSYTRPEHVVALVQSILAAPLDPVRRGNVVRMAQHCAHYLERVVEHLRASVQVLRDIHVELDELRSIGLTARYLAQHIEIEASQVDAARDSFVTLARSIHGAIDHLESVLRRLVDATRAGADQLDALRHAVEEE